jgi:hypothetical protein
MKQLLNILKISLLLIATACGGNAGNSNGKGSKKESGFVYYIGEKWSKRTFGNDSSFDQAVNQLRENIIAVVGGNNKATATYMGKTATGLHLAVTNLHVLDDFNACSGIIRTAPFQFETPVGANYFCEKELMRFPSVDLAVISLAAHPDDKILQNKKGLSFASNFIFNNSQQFITAGFGVHKNEGRSLVIDDSDECRLISNPGQFQQLGSKKIWSMAVACDISIGDSGSPVIDAETGKIVGLMWSGIYPKFKDRASFESIEKIIDSTPELIWNSYNYAVPVTEIQNQLEEIDNTIQFNLVEMLEKGEVYRVLFE